MKKIFSNPSVELLVLLSLNSTLFSSKLLGATLLGRLLGRLPGRVLGMLLGMLLGTLLGTLGTLSHSTPG